MQSSDRLGILTRKPCCEPRRRCGWADAMRTRHCQGNCRRRWPYRQGARFTRDARSLSIAAALKLQLCMSGRRATELSVIWRTVVG